MEEILKKHKSCRGCKCYNLYSSTHGSCMLRLPVEKINPLVIWHKYSKYNDIFVDIKPKEPCPKPMNTNEELYWGKKLGIF